jgi:hypothetical protein
MKKETKLQELERRVKTLEDKLIAPQTIFSKPFCICGQFKESTSATWYCPIHGMQTIKVSNI